MLEISTNKVEKSGVQEYEFFRILKKEMDHSPSSHLDANRWNRCCRYPIE